MTIEFKVGASDTPNSGVQLSYPLRMVMGIEGTLADNSLPNASSCVNTTTTPIAWGTMVAYNTSAPGNETVGVRPVTSAADSVLGLLIGSNTYENSDQSAYDARAGFYPNPHILSDGRAGCPSEQAANYITHGTVITRVVDAIANPAVPGSPVRFYLVDNSASVPGAFLGRFTTTAVPGKTALITSGAAWVSGSDANGLARLQLNLPTTPIIIEAD